MNARNESRRTQHHLRAAIRWLRVFARTDFKAARRLAAFARFGSEGRGSAAGGVVW